MEPDYIEKFLLGVKCIVYAYTYNGVFAKEKVTIK